MTTTSQITFSIPDPKVMRAEREAEAQRVARVRADVHAVVLPRLMQFLVARIEEARRVFEIEAVEYFGRCAPGKYIPYDDTQGLGVGTSEYDSFYPTSEEIVAYIRKAFSEGPGGYAVTHTFLVNGNTHVKVSW